MIGVLVVLASITTGVVGDEVPRVPAASANPIPANDLERTGDPAEERRRQETAAAAVWVLVGVTILGLTMLVLVMLLGGHTRRIVRTPLPGRSRDDPFWYLRPERERAAEANVGEERDAADEDSRHERPTDDA